ncbi:predicted protein [Lichtheimia corymbifera JMRC:FSU:9682]|uniref:Uncharacterized protein n=1 Tax=Lichtheimia corymbifera JMRC:FSU:9682 TaxID=1263082 RepID=A0A068S6U7_9FUNG|nr:predicted protein [Lichtheimia corymbifera JMRC:FSU:9682]
MKFSALVLATAAIIATASAVKELGPDQYCHNIETQATCEEYSNECEWDLDYNQCDDIPPDDPEPLDD